LRISADATLVLLEQSGFGRQFGRSTPNQELTMHRRSFIAANAATLALGGMTIAGWKSALAQDATPGADAIAVIDLAPGVTAEVFFGAPSVLAPGKTVYLARFVFDAGKAIFPHSHPGTTVLGVAEGSFGWTLVKGTAHVVRGAAGPNPSAPEDLTGEGADVVLEPGDAIYYEDDVVHTARGAGDTPALVFGTLILEAGAPLLMPAYMDMGTPSS
jgi:quercetin dioxygenase-like cupin family protein